MSNDGENKERLSLANAPANWSTARQTFAFSNAPHKITSKTETV